MLAARQASLSFTTFPVLWPLLSFLSGACSNSCLLSWWYLPTISSSVVLFCACLQSFPASGSFSNELALCIRWPKYGSFSFSISPSNEYSGLISFRIDWFDLLAVQGLSRVFSNTTVQKQQFFSTQPFLWSNSQTLQRSAFFIVQLANWTLLSTFHQGWASLVAQTVKCLPAVRETRVWFLGQENPLEKEMAAQCSTLSWKIPWTEEPGRLRYSPWVMGRKESDTTEQLHFLFSSGLLQIWGK